ncbi:hypothetical protein RC083_05095 [Pseudoalteromonas haloplanktis]|uniref:Orphan protein n=1 Tax=Pseudoalteromonas haloplanktis TaxID=228 RepID=A0ABU1BAM4_PSEHA|nr:hypothetical protein [Pseudoalteromonas haloplanktis]MDQ9090969.1 hypothetical protein [Pseudoalteromonas haloplanktis]
MMKNNFTALLLAFIAGVACASIFFGVILFSQLAAIADDAQSEQAYQKFVTEIQSISLESVSDHAVSKHSQTAEVDVLESSTSSPDVENTRALETQLAQLQVELEAQRKLVKTYEKRLTAPSDLEQALLTKFDEQNRNEEWAYRTETAMKDFLQMADLSISPELVSAQCKSSVCKFELVAPQDIDDFGHTQWRELNDQLVKQEFWQQFTVTTSKSSDRDFSLLLATESD